MDKAWKRKCSRRLFKCPKMSPHRRGVLVFTSAWRWRRRRRHSRAAGLALAITRRPNCSTTIINKQEPRYPHGCAWYELDGSTKTRLTETSMDLTEARARKWRISSPKVVSSESRPAVEAERYTRGRTRLACAGSSLALALALSHPPTTFFPLGVRARTLLHARYLTGQNASAAF